MSLKKFWPVIIKGLLERCPSCGKGKLYYRYLKQVEHCDICNENLGVIRADDGPAWLTILIVGHLLAPFIIAFSFNTIWPNWLSISVWSVLAVVLAMMILPRAKGLFIGILWKLKNKGYND